MYEPGDGSVFVNEWSEGPTDRVGVSYIGGTVCDLGASLGDALDRASDLPTSADSAEFGLNLLGSDARTGAGQNRPLDLGLAVESDQPIRLLLGFRTAPHEDEPWLRGFRHGHGDLGCYTTGSSGNQDSVVRAGE